MATKTESNAPALSNQSGANFTQQGSLDWVALGRMQYSTSVAILARLSKAGIDPLTLAVGQSMCLRLPIGSHGEKVLRESMTRLTAKSIGADLIWFGIGIRHVLRDLVQTSQGCSLVALCAALTQAHSISASALVIYEIAKLCGGPQDPLPSLEQWEILVGTAAPIFENTTFGLHLGQISKVGTQSRKTPVFRPTDLAKTLLSIGQVAHGSLQTFSIRVDQRCSWIATWADYVLGLRIVVRDARGIVVYENHNTNETSTQLYIDFDPDEECEGVLSSYNINEHITGHEYMSSSNSLRIEPYKRGLQYKCSTDDSKAPFTGSHHPLRSTLGFIRPFFARRMECRGIQVSRPRRIEQEEVSSADIDFQMRLLLARPDYDYQDRDNSTVYKIQ